MPPGWSWLLLALALMHGPLPAPAAGTGVKATDVGLQQQRVQRDFVELEQKTMRVIEGLQETDPARARQLQNALDWARDKILSGRLGNVADLLNAGQLAEARDLQPGMTADLGAMLRLLQEELGEYERLQKRLEQLQAWLEQTQALAREEWREARDSEKAQDAAAEQQRLEAQIARLERLLEAQKDLRQRTEKALAAGQPGFSGEAAKQAELERETRALQQAAQGEVADTKAAEAGAESLARAAGAQARSAENLEGRQAPSALADQAQAIEQLAQALSEMKRERERQQRLDAPTAQAAQDQTEAKTGALDSEMSQAGSPTGEGQDGQDGAAGQDGEGQSGQPGQSSIQQAQRAMQQASSQLGKKSFGKAAPEQKEAHAQLGKAAEDLKEEIKKVTEAQREALRAALKEMLEKMLVQQKAATLRTAALHEAKAKSKWTEDLGKELGNVRESEVRIGNMADQAAAMVIRDGSSVVFRSLLNEVQQGLTSVVARIEQEDIGTGTRDLQREIEKTIEELIAALDETTEPPPEDESPPPEETPPNDPPPEPLIALTAELRLLKARQLRVNQRTTAVEEAYRTTNRPEQKADLDRVQEQQRAIHALTRELLEKLAR